MQRKTPSSLSLMDWKVHSSGWPSVMRCPLPPVLLGESTQHRVWYQLLSKILSTEMTGGPVGLGKCAGRFLQLIPSMSEVEKYRGGGGRGRREVHHENVVVLSQAFVVFFTPPDQTCSRIDFKSNFLQKYVIIQHILYANNMLSRRGYKGKDRHCSCLLRKALLKAYSVQLLSRVQLLASQWTAARQASLSITNSQSPPKPMSIESVMPSNHLTLCHPLLLLPSILPSIRVFSTESALRIRWLKYWSFSFNISPPNECQELIYFRMDYYLETNQAF